jgi:hypothetical protein
MLRLVSNLLWLLINILPERLCFWLMDRLLPDWEEAARKAMKRRP